MIMKNIIYQLTLTGMLLSSAECFRASTSNILRPRVGNARMSVQLKDPFTKISIPYDNRNILTKVSSTSKLISDNEAEESPIFSTLATIFLSLVILTVPFSSALAENLSFDPASFQPVCHFSDVVYQFLKFSVGTIIGNENLTEYGPIIASLLLRIRLELCVIESYFFEAVVPFIQERGVSWILPFHETVETLLTGSIFAIATNIILLTSTKIISFLFVSIDILTGLPTRLLSGLLKKLGDEKIKPLSIVSTVLSTYGQAVGGLKNFVESFDTFVSKYSLITTVCYIGFKYAHYKLF